MTLPAIANLTQQTTTGTGAGNLTLVSKDGYRTFSSAFGTGATPDVFYYFIIDTTNNAWEYGSGHMSDATTLVRDTVISSSNNNSAVNFSAGTKIVVNDLPAGFQINSQSLATVATSGSYTDLSNKPSIQAPITLTTTGTSGAATFDGNVLNIPNYAPAGGGVTSLNGETGDISLTSTGSTVSINAAGSSINLEANPTTITKAFAQTSHGFSVGNWLYFDGSVWALSEGLATSSSDLRSNTLGVVIAVISADVFVVNMGGYTGALSGLTPGQYFLSVSTPGAMTQTPPSMPTDEGKVYKPIFVAISATEGFVQIQGGTILTAVPDTNFANVISGTNNTATMTVGSGASIVASGAGVITPTNITGLVGSPGTDITTTGSGTVASPYSLTTSAGMKAGASSTTNRLFAIATAVSSNSVPYVSGEYYCQIRVPFTVTTVSGGTNSSYGVEFLPSETVTTANIGVYVTTGVAAATAKIAVYATSTTTGVPTSLIYETGDLDVSTSSSYAYEAHTLTFYAGVKYVFVLRNKTNAVAYRAANTTAQHSMGLTTSAASAFYTMFSRTMTYANPATDPYAYTSADRKNGLNEPLIIFSVA